MMLSVVFAVVWQVAPVNGAPGLLRDGKPVSPILFWQRELEKEDVEAMYAAGVDQFSMFVSGAHDDNPYWKEDGSFSAAAAPAMPWSSSPCAPRRGFMATT